MGVDVNMSLYSVCFWLVTLFHVGNSLANFLGFNRIWLVNGKPGDGSTPLEKVLNGVFAMWYMATILGVLYANSLQDNKVPLQVAMVPLLFYHIGSFFSFAITDFGANLNALNPEKASPLQIGLMHGAIGSMSLV